MASFDVSYKLVPHKDTVKLFKVMSGILPSFYSFSVAVVNNPVQIAEQSRRLSTSEKFTMSTSNSDGSGSLNSSMNTNLVENSELKQSMDSLEDETGLEPGSHLVDYYEAALLFHSIPELSEVSGRLLSELEGFEAGGLHMLNIFVDSELQLDYKLFQSFILNFFIWGSHPIVDYFEGKEHLTYSNNVNRSFVIHV